MAARPWTIRPIAGGRGWSSRRSGGAFTLAELLVVLFIIGLLVAIVLPSAAGLFTAGADAQAYNALAGQLAGARMLAIQQRTYAGVHAQLADNTDLLRTRGLANTCFTAVVWDDPNTPDDPNFVLAEGFSPRKMPGAMAFGRLDNNFCDSNTGVYQSDANANPQQFTSLTFVFAPNGQLVDGKDANFPSNDSNHPAFDVSHKDTRNFLWDPAVANGKSVKATVMFDYDKFSLARQQGKWNDYLTRYGQIVAVNLYTGTPLGR